MKKANHHEDGRHFHAGVGERAEAGESIVSSGNAKSIAYQDSHDEGGV